MNSTYLDEIVVRFPKTDDEFANRFLRWLEVLGQSENNILALNVSAPNFHPRVYVDFHAKHSDVLTDFIFSSRETLSIKIEDLTGEYRQSPHSYQYLGIEQVTQRLLSSGIQLVGIDHLGFNLPWFASELHPSLLQLRARLSSQCLYHRFPTGELWDFVIPGDIEEIACSKAVDYATVRRPKFELVSFDKASTPLIQFDLNLKAQYEELLELFPEALNDPERENLWIYLTNPYGLDICLVANEFSERDWSDFFEGSRI